MKTEDRTSPATGLSKEALSRRIRELATEVGFDLVGLAPAVVGLGAERLSEWLAAGKHGEMGYMAKHEEARRDPNRVLDGVRSLVVVAMGYRTVEPEPATTGFARISRYAWNRDYHDLVRQRLLALTERLLAEAPGLACRAVVDSAPVMERDYAQLAGLGWIAKNTLLINKQLGSWLFLGALLLDRELDYDRPHPTDHCGTCTRCLDACPTGAFDGPYRLDPRRCISYLTIEHRSAIPRELRRSLGSWLFGCDICQEVCPWNRRAPRNTAPELSPRSDTNPVALRSLLGLGERELRTRFRGTPLLRAKRSRLLRNAALVAGNQQAAELLPHLQPLRDDPDPTLREAVQWAIARIRGSTER